MSASTLNSIRLSTLALGVALALPGAALAGDVSVQLDAGAGFSVKDNTGVIERLRVDEATGNVSRNGALFVHTTGFSNLFVGPAAGNPATTGVGRNSAFGQNALGSNTSGYANTAVGYNALRANTSGFNNAAVGYGALRNSVGFRNSAVGSFALFSNVVGGANSAVGYRALRANTGNVNAAFGASALTSNTAGYGNAAVGYEALRNNTSGHRNVAIGDGAGLNQTTGNDNIYLANQGTAAESGRIRIGTSPTHTQTFVAGIRGVTTFNADAIPVLIDSVGQLGTASSSRSVKKEIRDMGDATDRLLELRPVTFRYQQQQTLPGGREVPPEYGLIAEEVAEVLPDLVVYDESGRPFTVKYHEMPPMLLNEMQKQQKRIEAQEREIAALTARLAQLEASR